MKTSKKKLSSQEQEALLSILKIRFEKNMKRHKGIDWSKVQAKLEANSEKLWSLNAMEETGGDGATGSVRETPRPGGRGSRGVEGRAVSGDRPAEGGAGLVEEKTPPGRPLTDAPRSTRRTRS